MSCVIRRIGSKSVMDLFVEDMIDLFSIELCLLCEDFYLNLCKIFLLHVV